MSVPTTKQITESPTYKRLEAEWHKSNERIATLELELQKERQKVMTLEPAATNWLIAVKELNHLLQILQAINGGRPPA